MSKPRWTRMAPGDYYLRGSVADGLPIRAEVYQDTQGRWQWYTEKHHDGGAERTLAEAKRAAEEASV